MSKFLNIQDQLSIISRGVEEILPENELIDKLSQSYKNTEFG